jgi:hypothetical protein
MKAISLILLMVSFLFGMQLSGERHFVGKINTMKIHNGVLYIAGEGGVLALDENMHSIFINQDLMDVESIDFVQVDGDVQSEMLISSWLSFMLLDHDGSKLARNDISASMVSNAMPITHYNDAGTLKIVAYEPSSSYTSPNMKQFSYNPSYASFGIDWSYMLDEYASINPHGLQFVDGELYSMQIAYDSEHIFTHDLSDGTVLRDFNKSKTMTTFKVDKANDILVVGTANTLEVYRLSTFELIDSKDIAQSVKMIELFGNYIAVVANNKSWLGDISVNNIYLFEFNTGILSEKYSMQSGSEETRALTFKEDGTLFFSAGTTLYEVQNGLLTREVNLDNGVYDPYYSDIRSIVAENFGMKSLIVSSLDLYDVDENNVSSLIYHNGLLGKKMGLVNIDSDEEQEKWVSDWYRTYVYDHDNTLMWILPHGTNIAKAYDINADGTAELVLLANETVQAYNRQGEMIWSYQDRILNFDIKDIDNDGLADIAYMSYSESGDIFKVVDTSKTLKYEKQTYEYATNIHLFEYVLNPEGGYSVLFNVGGTYRIDLIEDTPMSYVEGSGFIDEYFNSAIVANMDTDSEMEIIRATNEGVWVYDIFAEKEYDEYGYPIYESTPLKHFSLSVTQLRGLALFDKELDGVQEVLLAYDEKLALYTFDGVKLWEYTDTVDSGFYEENHFTHIKPIYSADTNHKIFVSGYSLYEFDKNGNYVSKVKASQRYMVNSSGSYANPFEINSDGSLTLVQMGIFDVNSGINPIQPSIGLFLKKGWNLVSLPTVMSVDYTNILSIFANAKHVWSSINGVWYYASTESAYEDMVEQNIVSLSNKDGFWVYNLVDEYIGFDGVRYSVVDDESFLNSTSLWGLWGNGTYESTQKVCNDKSNLKVIWVYDGIWSAYGCSETYNNLIDSVNGLGRLETLKPAQGFWSYVK